METLTPPGANTFLACQAGDYSVVVSNVAGMVTSAVATVVFTNPAPALPGHFDSISRLADGSVQLNARPVTDKEQRPCCDRTAVAPCWLT